MRTGLRVQIWNKNVPNNTKYECYCLYQNTAKSVTFASSTICIFMTLHSVILHRFHTGSGALPASYPFGTGRDAAVTRIWPVTQFHLHRDQECVEIYLQAPSAFKTRCLIKKQEIKLLCLPPPNHYIQYRTWPVLGWTDPRYKQNSPVSKRTRSIRINPDMEEIGWTLSPKDNFSRQVIRSAVSSRYSQPVAECNQASLNTPAEVTQVSV